MKRFSKSSWLPLGAAMALTIGAACVYANVVRAEDVKLTLSGDQESPAVKTKASGSGAITIKDDMSVSGSVKTKNVKGTAAHIHEGAPGQNGPVIIPLTKSGDTWKVPDNAKLTDAQYQAFKAGNLYVNVHTKAHPNGEVRAQLKPAG